MPHKIIYRVGSGFSSSGQPFTSRTEALAFANHVLREAVSRDEAIEVRIWTEENEDRPKKTSNDAEHSPKRRTKLRRCS